MNLFAGKCSRFSYVDLVLAELLAAREGVKLLDHLGTQKVGDPEDGQLWMW